MRVGNRRSARSRGLLLAGCAFLLSPPPLGGQTVPAPRTLSLDTRYLVTTNSNRAVAAFGIELMELASLPASQIEFAGGETGLGSALLLTIATGFLSGPFSLAYHEYGHGTRSAAVGFKPFYGHGDIPTDEQIDQIFASSDPTDTFLEYYFESLSERGGGYTLTSRAHTRFPPPSQEEMREDGWSLNIRAGGLNNEMYFTETIEDHLARDGGSLAFLMLYYTGKIAAWRARSSTDKQNIMSDFRALGYDFDETTIDKASQATFLLSSLTYQFAIQVIHTLQGAPIYFEPWTWRGFQMPNTAFYMTGSGLSYKLRSGYQSGDWRFPFDIEHVFQGDRQTELTLGAERRGGRTDIALGATIGRRVAVEGSVRYRVQDRLALSAGYALYDRKNLRGQRLIPSLEDGPIYHDLYLRASLLY